MQEKGFIEKYKKEGEVPVAEIEITLKEALKLDIKRISKPGQRIYLSKDKLRTVKSGRGIAIISTSKGLMVSEEARKAGLGGEVICEVY